MRGLLLIGLLAAFLAGCVPAPDTTQAVTTLQAQVVHTVSYTRDPRTGLCFAGHSVGYSYGIFTNVPCTPEVLREIAR